VFVLPGDFSRLRGKKGAFTVLQTPSQKQMLLVPLDLEFHTLKGWIGQVLQLPGKDGQRE
jgi:hypothetical protein